MRSEFMRRGVEIAATYHCPDHPTHGIGRHRRETPWRKPGPGMFLQAAADLSLDLARVSEIFARHRPDAVMHLAAETHVDRSIDGPGEFMTTNFLGTFALLEVARDYWQGLDDAARRRFRFLHISTDEVFGSLGGDR